ncbi:Uncharacterised protein [Mycobacteroides abscessus subsp. abscessus]|uniref:Uncharacterized protein n=1 Tax=Mycobacteroides abscessus subsp. abscessus TaxID=1185650 RepID=A0AB38CZK1_9MYCO|nr:Uncharacterised protein [Mycobacteroides abscessus subsp. abscessus]SHP06858.1 Uncharacterised protein [Mycobacteroides abscessus subsp. abscessus]SHP38164.1 Uncharacterised protein [Mycobacteroides abscessus subsp. abscessus]SHP46067.1 Uncharacterised protein [Mycobacteroides abscessus subsp. abscessus]SHP46495.1 Uncharacterised protein [Mycobacteroides abscessus subsp. abscessus]
MTESEAPLTPGERLAIVSLYARLTVSQNRTSSGRLVSETPCYADLNRCSPETLSHKMIPVSRLTRGIETC